MCYFIGLEDLTANAFIEVLQHQNKRMLTFKEIESYGAQVIKVLNRKGKRAILTLSRENTEALFKEYADYFEEVEENGNKGILLKEGKEAEHLIEKFRGYLSLDVLRAFIDKTSVNKLYM